MKHPLPRFHTKKHQSGINMVDLMMWLVIAALLLATAIQTIGYYQKASHLHNMKSDLSGIGAQVMSASVMQGGKIDRNVIEEGASAGKWSSEVEYNVETLNTGDPYIRASHPDVQDQDAVYLFDPCGDLAAGVNVVSKDGSEACGIAAGPTNVGGYKNLDLETQTELGTGTWRGVASSGNGSLIISGDDGSGNPEGGYLHLSRNSGDSWSQVAAIGTGKWRGVAVTDDGSVLAAGQLGGYLFISKDGGTTWNRQDNLGFGDWRGVALANNGATIIATDFIGKTVYISSNAGDSWTKQNVGEHQWQSVGASEDGTKIIIGSNLGPLKMSVDSGVTWKEYTNLGTSRWHTIASSADGKKIIVGQDAGNLFTSVDYGQTWTKHDGLGTGNWRVVALSSDGAKMVAATQGNGTIRTSTNSGLTWTNRDDIGTGMWVSADLSSDGMKIAIGQISGSIFVGGFSR